MTDTPAAHAASSTPVATQVAAGNGGFTMRELTNGEIQILQRHAKWLESGGTDGESANLCGADLCNANLCGANLRGADLRSANLCSANLDFSCWPLWCGSKNVKADDRLVVQLIFHVTRLDISCCSGGVREAVEHIRAMAVSDLFCEYRSDVSKIEE